MTTDQADLKESHEQMRAAWSLYARSCPDGEVIDAAGLKSIKPFAQTASRFCIFEYIYFARPDSVVEGTGVYESRKLIGAELARESHVAADVVVPVPDSGVPAAMGYARECGVPFELGIIRNHYVGSLRIGHILLVIVLVDSVYFCLRIFCTVIRINRSIRSARNQVVG
jgi:hypothetical protein